jgi:tripartite-type tricarboxylate transporter receptor subunit TctC
VQIAFTGVPPVVQVVKGGQLRAIAVAAPKRSAVLPEVPTFAEVGMPGFQSSAWFGLVAPAGTPRAVIDKVAGDVSRIIVKPDFQARYITGVGLELLNQGPDQFAEFLNRDRATYANYIRDLGVKLD